MLFIISVSRSYPEAQARAVSQKPHTSPGRKSETNATESPMTIAASTKSFTKKSCFLRELSNDFAKDRYYGTLRRKKRHAKTVRPRGALTLHFREKYHGRSRSTLYGNSLSTTSRQGGCVLILLFTIKATEIPMYTYF